MAWFSGPSRHSHSHSPTRSYYSTSRHSSTSHYKRRPRDGYMQKMIYQLKKVIRNFYHYARRHPVKVFMLVVMPLLTGGALTSVLKQFGIRLPAGLSSVMGAQGSGRGGFGGSSFGGRSDYGGGGGIQGLMKMAQMFM